MLGRPSTSLSMALGEARFSSGAFSLDVIGQANEFNEQDALSSMTSMAIAPMKMTWRSRFLMMDNMKNTGNFIQIYSPEQKEEWKYDGQDFYFSSLDWQMLVIDAVGMDWSAHQSVLLSCIESTAKLAFFRVTPWFPRRSRIRDALSSVFPNCKVDGFDVLGYFEPTSRDLGLLFDLWQEMGAWASGEWQIGGCFGEFQNSVIETSCCGLEYFLREIQNVGCILSLEEMQQSTLLTYPFVGLAANLNELLEGRIQV